MSRATKRDPKHLQGWVSTCSMKLQLEYAKAFFVAMMRTVWWEEKYVMVSSNVSIAIMMGVVGMAERQVGGHEWITGHFRLKANPPLLLHTASAHIGIIITAHAHAHAHVGIIITAHAHVGIIVAAHAHAHVGIIIIQSGQPGASVG